MTRSLDFLASGSPDSIQRYLPDLKRRTKSSFFRVSVVVQNASQIRRSQSDDCKSPKLLTVRQIDDRYKQTCLGLKIDQKTKGWWLWLVLVASSNRIKSQSQVEFDNLSTPRSRRDKYLGRNFESPLVVSHASMRPILLHFCFCFDKNGLFII